MVIARKLIPELHSLEEHLCEAACSAYSALYLGKDMA